MVEDVDTVLFRKPGTACYILNNHVLAKDQGRPKPKLSPSFSSKLLGGHESAIPAFLGAWRRSLLSILLRSSFFFPRCDRKHAPHNRGMSKRFPLHNPLLFQFLFFSGGRSADSHFFRVAQIIDLFSNDFSCFQKRLAQYVLMIL